MKYELAKQLKDAGFPEDRDYKKVDVDFLAGKMSEYYQNPTLSRLIEACGDDFKGLDKNAIWEAQGIYWCCAEHGEGRKFGQGETPEEAVAKLWLALNRRQKKDKKMVR